MLMDPAARSVEPELAAAAATPAKAPGNGSYWLSSLELRSGADVQMVGVRAVPTEALRELLRLRESWRRSGQAHSDVARAAEPELAAAVPSAFELDVTLEADGRVTLPGDLLPAG